jgi:UDP-N-acetylmuramyl pentapeptide phosphotransferase/UDP-N-acetylglucosamine-1-phosphate transferase
VAAAALSLNSQEFSRSRAKALLRYREPSTSPRNPTVPNAGALIALLLLIASVVAIRWHRRTWVYQRQRPDLPEEHRAFHHRQYRRRMQLSSMLGVAGLAVFVGTVLLSPKGTPRLFILWWCGTLLLLLWIALLALADLLAIRNFTRRDFQHIADQQHVLRARLRALRKQQEHRKP